MAEIQMIVCDYDEKPAVATATLKLNGSATSLQLDVCQKHLDELRRISRKARRGRRSGSYAAS